MIPLRSTHLRQGRLQRCDPFPGDSVVVADVDPLELLQTLQQPQAGVGEGRHPEVQAGEGGGPFPQGDELLQGLVDYRGEGKWAYNRYRRLSTAEERRQGVKRREDCSTCGDLDNWGRGDVVPFLDRVG